MRQVSVSKQVNFVTLLSRTHLAILHYNENSKREQAITREGAKQWKLKTTKARKGHQTVCPIKVEPTYGRYAGALQ